MISPVKMGTGPLMVLMCVTSLWFMQRAETSTYHTSDHNPYCDDRHTCPISSAYDDNITAHYMCQLYAAVPAPSCINPTVVVCNHDSFRTDILHKHNSLRSELVKTDFVGGGRMKTMSYDLEREFLAYVLTHLCMTPDVDKPFRVFGCKYDHFTQAYRYEYALFLSHTYTGIEFEKITNLDEASLYEQFLRDAFKAETDINPIRNPDVNRVGCARRISNYNLHEQRATIFVVCTYRWGSRAVSSDEKTGCSSCYPKYTQCNKYYNNLCGEVSPISKEIDSEYTPVFNLYRRDNVLYLRNGNSCRHVQLFVPGSTTKGGIEPLSDDTMMTQSPILVTGFDVRHNRMLYILQQIGPLMKHIFNRTIAKQRKMKLLIDKRIDNAIPSYSFENYSFVHAKAVRAFSSHKMLTLFFVFMLRCF